ncbi:MAG: energy-coupling factor ABC transporter ATP-binding protein [Candidatus Helarchaeota archaeon]
MIECFGISFTYPDNVQALRNINLRIEDKEFVAIIGENGAGKTTLAKCINGLLRPQVGKIYIDGEDTSKQSVAQLARKIGFVFQNSDHQIFAQTVEDEIMFGLKNLNFEKEEIEKRTENILKNLNLKQYRDVSPFNLSGGERKRVALASILCLDPEILILDEPTLGQDSHQKEYLIKLINDLRDKGKTILIITHDIEFASEYVPRLIVMSKGRIIADGPNDVISNNEFILKNASLMLPQLPALSKALKKHKKFENLKANYSDVYSYYNEIKKYLKS